MSDELARLLEIIAETFDGNSAIMGAAARRTAPTRDGGDGRTIVHHESVGARDAFMVAADFLRELAVSPPASRAQIAARLVLVEDLGETVVGAQIPEATRA